MTRDQRVAISRILCDILKADGTIEAKAMTEMIRLMDEYHVTPQDQSDSHKMLFTQAVRILHDELPRLERRGIYNNVERFAKICGHRPNGILLLLSFYFCMLCDDMSTDPKKKPYMVASERNSHHRGRFLAYIESSYNEEYNAELSDEASYQLYNLKCQMAGLNLLYVPKMCEDFKRTDKQQIVNIVKFLVPMMEDEVAESIYHRICESHTADLYRRLIFEPLSSQIDRDVCPTLFINVATSTIPYCMAEGPIEYRCEYLCIPLSKSIKEHLQDIFAFCYSKMNGKAMIQLNESTGQLKIFGFYRDIFNYLLMPPASEPDLIFEGQDFKTGKYYISMRFADRKQSINLSPKEYDAFLDIAIKTHKTKQHGLSIGLNGKELAPVISHVRSKIATAFPELAMMDRYKPERDGNIYTLKLDKNKIFIRRTKPGNSLEYEEVPLAEYRRPS